MRRVVFALIASGLIAACDEVPSGTSLDNNSATKTGTSSGSTLNGYTPLAPGKGYTPLQPGPGSPTTGDGKVPSYQQPTPRPVSNTRPGNGTMKDTNVEIQLPQGTPVTIVDGRPV